MQWLKIKEGETITATIDFSSIKSVVKHWTGQRSELCLGEGCPHCQSLPKRWRYHARLIVDNTPTSWEFGEQTMAELNTIPHDTNFAHITITRIGESRQTRYQLSARQDQPGAYDPRDAVLASNFLRRKYGHTFEDQDQR